MSKLITAGGILVCLVLYMSCSDHGVSSQPDISPPVVNITSPMDGDTLYSNPLITVSVEDETGIGNVSYYVDDILIGEDGAPPYEEVWYAGFWPSDEYMLYVKAEDINGRTGVSDTLSLFVSPEARIVPRLYLPPDSTYIGWFTTLTFTCHPCPGATGYVVEWHCKDCTCRNEWCGIKYVESATNQIFVFIRMTMPEEDMTIKWRCRARWSEDFASNWSEKRILIIRAGSGNSSITQ